jgi:hypothetical protein
MSAAMSKLCCRSKEMLKARAMHVQVTGCRAEEKPDRCGISVEQRTELEATKPTAVS